MIDRRFVLQPLAEIAPHAVHPVLQKDIAQLLAETGDFKVVKRWNPNVQRISVETL
jgi:7,8-dihydro-6-hydroxymethylpterin-pyrophosphokinase